MLAGTCGQEWSNGSREEENVNLARYIGEGWKVVEGPLIGSPWPRSFCEYAVLERNGRRAVAVNHGSYTSLGDIRETTLSEKGG